MNPEDYRQEKDVTAERYAEIMQEAERNAHLPASELKAGDYILLKDSYIKNDGGLEQLVCDMYEDRHGLNGMEAQEPYDTLTRIEKVLDDVPVEALYDHHAKGVDFAHGGGEVLGTFRKAKDLDDDPTSYYHFVTLCRLKDGRNVFINAEGNNYPRYLLFREDWEQSFMPEIQHRRAERVQYEKKMVAEEKQKCLNEFAKVRSLVGLKEHLSIALIKYKDDKTYCEQAKEAFCRSYDAIRESYPESHRPTMKALAAMSWEPMKRYSYGDTAFVTAKAQDYVRQNYPGWKISIRKASYGNIRVTLLGGPEKSPYKEDRLGQPRDARWPNQDRLGDYEMSVQYGELHQLYLPTQESGLKPGVKDIICDIDRICKKWDTDQHVTTTVARQADWQDTRLKKVVKKKPERKRSTGPKL